MGKILKLEASTLYEKTRQAKTRFIVHEGGARSSKTYSILEYLITDAFERGGQGIEYDIVRATMPALRASAMKDFFDILKVNKLYRESAHNMTENTYRLRGNTFNFYSTSSSKEDEQKIRGRKRNIIFLNEANEIPYETFEQVNLRTTEQIILDYNPSQEEHWIYDKVIPKPDCTFIHSTYKDNPFLEGSIVGAIESYETDDADTWKVFGLGLRGKRTGLIYQNWDIVPEFPICSDILYGLDFGFTDPKVVVKLGRLGRDIFIDELFYKPGIAREDFIPILKQLIPSDKRNDEMYADCEDPESIDVIYRAGFNIKPADKEKQSVINSIEAVKSYHQHITARSVNIIRDYKNWKWKVDRLGNIIPETPIHAFSHGPDAVRYPVWTHWGKEYRLLSLDDMRSSAVSEMESVGIAGNY